MTTLPPAGWYREPSSPTGLRWWDGTRWTEHVTSPTPSQQAATPPEQASAGDEQVAAGEPADQQGAEPQPAASPALTGWRGAAMLAAPVVQISQQGRVMESTSVYALADAAGTPLGRAAQVGQGRGGRLLKAMTDMDRSLQVTIQFTDAAGAEVMRLVKPGRVGPQRFSVVAADGTQIGGINQRIRMVREAFDLVIGDQPAGTLASENWFDFRFSVLDVTGRPFAVVHKRYEGYARAAFTSADEYVVEYVAGTSPEQRALALASALAMDIALYQR